MFWWAVVGSFAVGLLLPIQTGINAQLRLRVGHPIVAALCSFSVGTLATLLYALVTGVHWPSGDQLAATDWWNWFGGALGATYVASVIILAPKLGAAALVSTVVTGQVVSSLILDNFGSVGYAVHPFNLGRLAGAVLLIGGGLLIRRPAKNAPPSDVPAVSPLILLFLAGGLLCGAAQSVQSGMNSTLGRHVGQSIFAALVSFVVGTSVLALICVGLRVPRPALAEVRRAPWWNWLGGVIGAFFVATAATTAPILGAATLTGLLVAGQMLASLLLDHFGLLGFRRDPIHLWRIGGAALLVGGVILTGVF